MPQGKIQKKNAPVVEYLQLLTKDRRLAKILVGQTGLTLNKSKDLPAFLYWTIINQQLSAKVGAVFYQRFLDLFGGKLPAPADLVSTPPTKLRALGLSNAKVRYIQNVAQFDLDHELNHKSLESLNDADALTLVRSIKGVGPWTASVFLMNAVGREDIFPIDDLILQKAIASLYKLDRTDKKKFLLAVQQISSKWSPYRTYASLHLWHWADNLNTKKSKDKKKPNIAKKASVSKKR